MRCVVNARLVTERLGRACCFKQQDARGVMTISQISFNLCEENGNAFYTGDIKVRQNRLEVYDVGARDGGVQTS